MYYILPVVRCQLSCFVKEGKFFRRSFLKEENSQGGKLSRRKTLKEELSKEEFSKEEFSQGGIFSRRNSPRRDFLKEEISKEEIYKEVISKEVISRRKSPGGNFQGGSLRPPSKCFGGHGATSNLAPYLFTGWGIGGASLDWKFWDPLGSKTQNPCP